MSTEEWAKQFVRTQLEPLLEDFSKRPNRAGYLPFDETVALIATHAAPIVVLLRESKRSHDGGYNDESADYPPCPKYHEDAAPDAKCTCSADAWNARVEAVLKGNE